MVKTGVVYLVGAGPGSPDLITVRGLKTIRRADVIIYDRLANKALLDEAKPQAKLFFAGKSDGHHVMRQEEINGLILSQAKAGRVVVRLKGGDPFTFGRGGEEAEVCAAAGIRWEVIPGVSSVNSVPASAGIPITHRGVSGSFVVVTAHRRAGNQGDDLNWEAIAQIKTIVVLMGVKRLRHVVAQVTKHGRSPDTPVAIIERGTQPTEKVIVGTLADIVDKAKQANITPPAITVIGEVVSIREKLFSLHDS